MRFAFEGIVVNLFGTASVKLFVKGRKRRSGYHLEQRVKLTVCRLDRESNELAGNVRKRHPYFIVNLWIRLCHRVARDFNKLNV